MSPQNGCVIWSAVKKLLPSANTLRCLRVSHLKPYQKCASRVHPWAGIPIMPMETKAGRVKHPVCQQGLLARHLRSGSTVSYHCDVTWWSQG